MVTKFSAMSISATVRPLGPRFGQNAHTVTISGDLKRVCEIDLGLISQCCLTKQVFKMNKQILANLSLKINVKVGVQASCCLFVHFFGCRV